MGLEDKRREFGRFLGFRGCEDAFGLQFTGIRDAIIDVVRDMEIPHSLSPLPMPAS